MKIKNRIILFSTILLIAMEQGIKLIINQNYMHDSFPIFKPWLYFSPMFNRDYSWLNSMFQLGVGKWIHIGIVCFMILVIFIFYKFLINSIEATALIQVTFSFLISAAICSLIDKLFWNGSLDYIYVKNLFTFDLKDVYINIFIGLVILMFAFDYKGLRKADDKEVLSALKVFLRGKKREQ